MEFTTGRIADRWPQLTEDEVRAIDGDSRKLVALVHQRTGEELSRIESQIDEIAASSGGLMSRLTAPVTKSVVQAPGRTLAVSFAAGMLVGICLAGISIVGRRD